MSDKEKGGWKEYFDLSEVVGYFFRKKDPSKPRDFNLKAMHFINKFSMLVFLLAVLYLIARRFF